MAVLSFHLSAFSPISSIFLRELNGHDELLVYDNSTPCALALLNNIIVQKPSGNNDMRTALKAEKITVTDRDHLLAGIYKYTYGSHIESSLLCNSCGERYDMDFSLDDLILHNGTKKTDIKTDSEGFFCSDDGLRFRLPNGEDELAVLGLPSDQAAVVMFDRCLANPVAKQNKEIIEVMEELGPVLTTDLNINCPECESSQNIQFDLQTYLLTKIKNDSKKLAAEVHSIALAYGWSHKEILDLPRSLRQTYTAFINQN